MGEDDPPSGIQSFLHVELLYEIQYFEGRRARQKNVIFLRLPKNQKLAILAWFFFQIFACGAQNLNRKKLIINFGKGQQEKLSSRSREIVKTF